MICHTGSQPAELKGVRDTESNGQATGNLCTIRFELKIFNRGITVSLEQRERLSGAVDILMIVYIDDGVSDWRRANRC